MLIQSKLLLEMDGRISKLKKNLSNSKVYIWTKPIENKRMKWGFLSSHKKLQVEDNIFIQFAYSVSFIKLILNYLDHPQFSLFFDVNLLNKPGF